MSCELPGLNGIRSRFLSLLAERQAYIAKHTVAAWESDNAADQCANLEAAQNVLHQLSGSAGSLGFNDLGQAARRCEEAIIDHTMRHHGTYHQLPESFLEMLDEFVSLSQAHLSYAQ